MKYCPQCAKPLQEVTVDDTTRTGCADEKCGFVLWNNPTPVVAAIVETDRGVVLAHNIAWPKNFYSIITGFLEPGEDPQEGVIRETREELGLQARSTALVGVYGFPQQNQVIIAYHLRAEGAVTLNHELDDYKWVRPAELKSWNMGTGLAIQDWQRQQGYKPITMAF